MIPVGDDRERAIKAAALAHEIRPRHDARPAAGNVVAPPQDRLDLGGGGAGSSPWGRRSSSTTIAAAYAHSAPAAAAAASWRAACPAPTVVVVKKRDPWPRASGDARVAGVRLALGRSLRTTRRRGSPGNAAVSCPRRHHRAIVHDDDLDADLALGERAGDRSPHIRPTITTRDDDADVRHLWPGGYMPAHRRCAPDGGIALAHAAQPRRRVISTRRLQRAACAVLLVLVAGCGGEEADPAADRSFATPTPRETPLAVVDDLRAIVRDRSCARMARRWHTANGELNGSTCAYLFRRLGAMTDIRPRPRGSGMAVSFASPTGKGRRSAVFALDTDGRWRLLLVVDIDRGPIPPVAAVTRDVRALLRAIVRLECPAISEPLTPRRRHRRRRHSRPGLRPGHQQRLRGCARRVSGPHAATARARPQLQLLCDRPRGGRLLHDHDGAIAARPRARPAGDAPVRHRGSVPLSRAPTTSIGVWPSPPIAASATAAGVSTRIRRSSSRPQFSM